MSTTVTPKSNQQNADDLIGGDRTIKITKVTSFTGDQPIAVYFEGDNNKPYLPCKSMRRVMMKAWGKYTKDYTGRSMTIFCDPTVKWAGVEVGGIRISHMSDIKADITMALTANKQQRKKYTVKTLKVEAVAKADIELIKAGNTEAAKGVDAYTKWIGGLTAEEKAPLKTYHEDWTKTAKAVVIETEEEDWEIQR